MLQQIIKDNKHKRNKSFYSNRFTTKVYQETYKNQLKQQANVILQKAKHSYYTEQDLSAAIQYFQQYLNYCPNSNQALYLCGVSYLNQDKPIQAISRLSKINSSYQNKQNSLLLLSMAFNKINQIQKSLQTINNCLNNYPKFQEAYYFRGKIFLKIDNIYEAIKDFQCCLQLYPNSLVSKIGLGDCYRTQGNFQKALKFYNQVIKNSSLQINQREDLILKSAICYFYLQKYQYVINLLDNSKFPFLNKGSEFYFYLGQSYLNLRNDQNSFNLQKTNNYLGLQNNKKEKGILNLQYCIKLQTNKSLVIKSVKILLQLFIKDYQYYEAMNVVKLAENYRNECAYWIEVVQGFMLIIKAKYDEGYQKLKSVYSALKSSFLDNIKIKTQTKAFQKSVNSPNQMNKRLMTNKKSIDPTNQKLIQVSHHRKVYSLKHVGRPSLTDDFRRQPLLLSKNNLLNHKRTISNSKYKIKISNNLNLSIKKQHSEQVDRKKTQNKINFTQKEEMFLMPIVLKFKAYSQFFKNNYLRSLDTYDQYQNYMRDMFGNQSNQDIQYQKSICEALLMSESQMYEDGLQKYTKCIDIYYKQHKSVPIEPVLYKIIHIMQKALNYGTQILSHQKKYHFQNYLQASLNLIQNYRPILKNSHIAYYLEGLTHLVLERYQSAQFCLQKTLKLAQECSWKYLYVKGIIEIQNKKYYDAIKQFTAGLILQQKADLYLGRSISFLLEGFSRKKHLIQNQTTQLKKSVNLNQRHSKFMLQQQAKNQESQTTSEIFIQNSFQDLQKFIQLQTDQQQISLWVTKLLFYNNAFQQASKALQKISNKTNEIIQIQQNLQIYQGNFQDGGSLGQILISAFQGSILSCEQEKDLQKAQKQIEKQLLDIGIKKSYSKWLIILHFYIKKQYSILLKFLQKQIFKSTSQKEDELELRYNIAIVYLLIGQTTKAINVLSGLDKFCTNQQIKTRIQKFSQMDLIQDQCIPDLKQEINCNILRLSNYLVSHPAYIKEKQFKVYLKLSIPFPEFPKPNIKLYIEEDFLKKELNMNLIEKKLHAPWINKKNNQVVQFTQQLIEADTQFLKQSVIKQNNKSLGSSSLSKNNQFEQNGFGVNSSDQQKTEQ